MSLKQLVKRLDKHSKVKFALRNNSILNRVYYSFFLKIHNFQKNRINRSQIQIHGRDLLMHIHDILSTESITFFVDFGTLLGIVRENQLLGHDLDIDLGVLVESLYTREHVQAILSAGGCTLVRSFVYNDQIVEQSYRYKEIKFDICYYGTEGAHSTCYLFYEADDSYLKENEMNVVRFRYGLIEGIQSHDFAGLTVNVPKEPERILQEKYGADWRVPNKNWVYWKAPTAEYCKGLGKVIDH